MSANLIFAGGRMREHGPEVFWPHGEDDLVSRKYPALADESYVGEAGVPVGHRQVLSETPVNRNITNLSFQIV